MIGHVTNKVYNSDDVHPSRRNRGSSLLYLLSEEPFRRGNRAASHVVSKNGDVTEWKESCRWRLWVQPNHIVDHLGEWRATICKENASDCLARTFLPQVPKFYHPFNRALKEFPLKELVHVGQQCNTFIQLRGGILVKIVG